MDAADTIAAIATSAGFGGIGIVRVSGAAVGAIMVGITGRTLAPRQASFCRFAGPAGALIDEGIGVFFPAPRSYTGEDVLELHGHGGPVVLDLVLRRCLSLGARAAEPGEFTQRAYLNGKLDLAQAEAVADLIAARTEQAARSAAQSMSGEFSRRVAAFQSELTALRVLLEATLDFPEEGIDYLQQANVDARLERVLAAVAEATRAGRMGRLLNEGLRVALIGPVNVGKSSLINALSGEDVALVTPHAGTTRDLVREQIQIGGIALQIVDTAGLRQATDPVEEAGIARTWEMAGKADVVVLVRDALSGTELDPASLARIPAQAQRLFVHNKIDLAGEPARIEYRAGHPHVWLSAKHGTGLELLRQALIDQCAGGSTEGAFSARARHIRALEQAFGCIEAARAVLPAVELAAEDLRNAQHALGEITGEMAADDLLGEIFTRFCIGK
ncbi:MAG: tRNA uridine-5-carboxymethylaminomethyl(34) synthesis GTPase MnmE [Burkholderiales bacterium]|nr:tRNA uridine-5-carboxymethylaminomethyl(34) synthesis GTPase MnmE [Burkholderiales bacterium]